MRNGSVTRRIQPYQATSCRVGLISLDLTSRGRRSGIVLTRVLLPWTKKRQRASRWPDSGWWIPQPNLLSPRQAMELYTVNGRVKPCPGIPNLRHRQLGRVWDGRGTFWWTVSCSLRRAQDSVWLSNWFGRKAKLPEIPHTTIQSSTSTVMTSFPDRLHRPIRQMRALEKPPRLEGWRHRSALVCAQTYTAKPPPNYPLIEDTFVRGLTMAWVRTASCQPFNWWWGGVQFILITTHSLIKSSNKPLFWISTKGNGTGIIRCKWRHWPGWWLSRRLGVENPKREARWASTTQAIVSPWICSFNLIAPAESLLHCHVPLWSAEGLLFVSLKVYPHAFARKSKLHVETVSHLYTPTPARSPLLLALFCCRM